jgi:AcrR family transcriptional regulator
MAKQHSTMRRERRIETRRTQILTAAAKLFAEKGFHKTTTKEIAEAADVAEGTIYNYFASKDELLIAIINHLSAVSHNQELFDIGLEVDFVSWLIQSSSERVQSLNTNAEMFFLAVLPDILASPELRARFYQQTLEPLLKLFERHFQQRIEAGELPPLDATVATRILMCFGLGLLNMIILGDPLCAAAWNNPAQMREFIGVFLTLKP